MSKTSPADAFRLSSPLERYTHNLTELARQGTFSPLEDHDPAINRIFQILGRKHKNNPALLDDNETRRLAIVMETARCLAAGKAPEELCTKQIFMLDYEALLSTVPDDAASHQKAIQQEHACLLQELSRIEQSSEKKWLGLVKKRLRQPELRASVIHERLWATFIVFALQEKSSILFIDHFPRMIGAGPADEAIDMANTLVPLLARGQIQLIGACTLEQYRRYVERDALFQRRFQEIVIPGTYQIVN